MVRLSRWMVFQNKTFGLFDNSEMRICHDVKKMIRTGRRWICFSLRLSSQLFSDQEINQLLKLLGSTFQENAPHSRPCAFHSSRTQTVVVALAGDLAEQSLGNTQL